MVTGLRVRSIGTLVTKDSERDLCLMCLLRGTGRARDSSHSWLSNVPAGLGRELQETSPGLVSCARFVGQKWRGEDLNLRPLDYETYSVRLRRHRTYAAVVLIPSPTWDDMTFSHLCQEELS